MPTINRMDSTEIETAGPDSDPEKAFLRAKLAALEKDAAKRRALGVRPKPPLSPDGELIAAVCQKLGIRRVRLAEMLRVDPSILSRANAATEPKSTPAKPAKAKKTKSRAKSRRYGQVPLAEPHRAALRALLAGQPVDHDAMRNGNRASE